MQRILAGLLLLALSATPALAEQLVSKIAAVVNDEVITTVDVDHRLQQLLPADAASLTAEQRQQLWTKAREQLIDKALWRQRQAQLKLKVSDAELDRAVDDVASHNQLTRKQLMSAVEGEGLAWDAYREQLRQEILKFRMMQKDVYGQVEVTNHEIRQYYQDHIDQFRLPPTVRLLRLSFPLPADDAGARAVRREVATARQQLEAGTPFGDLLTKLRGAGKADGGDTGRVALGQLNPAFGKAIASLKAGELSQPVEVGGAIHLLQLAEREAGKVKPFEAVKNGIRDRLLKQKRQGRVDNYLKELRRKAYVDIRKCPHP